MHHMASGAGHAVKGGIFSQGDPVAAFGTRQRAYADGSLGACGGGGCGGVGALGAAPMKGPGHSYRGGIFTTATPDAPYGSQLTASADGVLGQTGPSPEDLAVENAAIVSRENAVKAVVTTGIVAGVGYLAWRYFKKPRRRRKRK
jgi:hypothetical protein